MADGTGTLTLEPEALYQPSLGFGVPGFLVPKSISDVKEIARMIALAEWAPDCYRDLHGNFLQPKIELAIMHGATVGLGPIAAVQAIAVINGKPSIWGDGALAVIEHSGLLEDMTEEYEVDDEEGLVAICSMRRRGRATAIVTRFSTAMADQAGLTRIEGPWQTYRERMLRMRARSWTMRDGFADVLRGLHLREEVEDYVTTAGRGLPRAPDREESSPGDPRHYPSPRSRRSEAFGASRPDSRPTAVADPPGGHRHERPVPELHPAGQTYTLVDADGVFIKVAGPDALRAAFERVFFDKHLSPNRVAGVWEANEPARLAIERLFGAEALAQAQEHISSIQGTSRPPSAGQQARREAAAVGAAWSDGDQFSEPDQALVLEINPTWGDQKVFQTYRAAITKLSDDAAGNRPAVSEFRRANQAIETRLRRKLSDRMPEIDKIYALAGVGTGSDAAA